MREELEQKLFLRWPTWFDVQGFEHGDGCFDILWRLFAEETQRMRTRGESGLACDSISAKLGFFAR